MKHGLAEYTRQLKVGSKPRLPFSCHLLGDVGAGSTEPGVMDHGLQMNILVFEEIAPIGSALYYYYTRSHWGPEI